MKNILKIIGAAILSLFLTLKYTQHQNNIEMRKAEIMTTTQASFPMESVSIKNITKCVIGIDTENSTGQGIVYAQKGNRLYIALPEHCLPGDDAREITLTTGDGQDIPYLVLDVIKERDADAAMLVLANLDSTRSLASVSSLGLASERTPVGDTVIMCSPFNPRGVKKKTGILIDEFSADFPITHAEPGDSGSPLFCRYGILGLNSQIENPEKSTVCIFIPMRIFEKLYLKISTRDLPDVKRPKSLSSRKGFFLLQIFTKQYT